ncbi:MAG: tetratricopeptide repeat protein [Bacteroidia bacterium]|nr:tetratricopeptide repeat protein [Bacteroidia bacterium]
MRTYIFRKIYPGNQQDWLQNILLIIGRLLAFVIFFMLCQQRLKAQQTTIYTDEIKYYNQGLELFDKEKYAAAQKYFEWYAVIAHNQLQKINAQYYIAVCALELFNPDAAPLFQALIDSFPENTKAKLATYQSGKLHYRNKNNKKAVHYLDNVDIRYLSGNDLKEFYFTYGYSLFKVERYVDAKKSFKNIKDEKSKYYDATNYYYGYVSYKSGAYDEALDHFGRIKYHKTFGPLAAVYVTQVYFARKQYKDVIAYCDTIKNREVADDVAGMLGQSYYQLNQYETAIPHLEQFMNAAPVQPTNSDFYTLGLAYARTGQYEKAIEQFIKIDANNDTIGPYVYYHLGASYLKLEKSSNALTAFNKCYQLKPAGSLAEIALFNSAKIADELNLQGAAMTSYVKLIDAYPQSEYASEARSNLGNLLLHARNFKEAMKILEGIKHPNAQDMLNTQRVSYYRAEELYLNNNYKEANELFAKCAEVSYDKKITALANFWLGEQAYKEQQYIKSQNHYKLFQNEEEIKSTRFYNLSFYNLGYAYLKTENYNKAIESFKLYVEKDFAMGNPEVYTDAVIRTADCYFVSKNYDKSIDYYNLVIQKQLNGADYALYQKSLILGVLGRNEEKITALKTLESNFPRSTYIDDAVYERADIYLKTEDYANAIEAFSLIITNYPRSIYLRKAMLNKSLALFNINKNEEALVEIKKLVNNYPNSDEARESVIILQNIYVNQGKGPEFLEIIKALPNVVVSASTQDSLSFESAINLFQKNDFNKASKAFGDYINKFPGGYFILKANYFKAECDYKLKSYTDALIGYEYVANSLRSDYTEKSTRQAAYINSMNKNYEIAYDYYSALERIASNKDNLSFSLIGQMKSCSVQGKTDSAATASIKYLNSGLTQKEGIVEARTNLGRYYIKHNNPDSAYLEYMRVLKDVKNVYGAEAKYHIALIQYMRKEYKSSQKTIFELKDQFDDYTYWVAKGFVLLADTYIKQNDAFQAKATLQSLLDNYDGQEIRQIAKVKLEEIIEMEKQQKSDSQKMIEQRIKQNENK